MKWKRLLFIGIFLGLICVKSQIGFGQNNIYGFVTDKTIKQPIIGATVYVNDLKKGAITDINGKFLIEKIPNGTYLFEVSYVGYKSLSERIKIDENSNQLTFSLNESPTELSEVVITGVTRSTEIKLSPVIIKPIDISKLNQSGSSNLIDGLKNIPGVNQITTGAAISKPTIRGLGYNRVITLMDGIKQEGQQWGDEHGIEIDEYAIDRVEIVKGPGSLLYGSDGIAGVLNFISPKAPQAGITKAQLITNYQSNNNLIGNSLSYAGNKNNIQWLGRLSQKTAGNYKNKYDGKVFNSGFKEFDASLFLGINKKWGYSHLNLSSFHNKVGLIEGERDISGHFIYLKSDGIESTATEQELNSFNIGIPFQNIAHYRITNNNYIKTKKGSINADFGFQNNIRKEFGEVAQPEIAGLHFDLKNVNFNIRYNFDPINSWETSVGIGGMHQKNQNKGIEFLIPEYNLFDLGGFIFSQKTFNEKITIAGGLRFDNRELHTEKLILDDLGQPTTSAINSFVKFNALNKSYSSYSGSVGLSYQLNKTSTIKMNLSRGFRTPNIAEIASNGRHEGTFRYEYGSAELVPEISRQIDFGYFLNSDHFTLEITPFANFISNYIFTKKLLNKMGNDSIPEIGTNAIAYKFVQDKAKLIGGEIYLDMHPHPLDWLHIENSFSIVRATQYNQPDSLKYLPFIPAPKYRGELKAQFNKIGDKLVNTYFKIAIDYFFAQNQYYKAYNTETTTPSYTLLGAGCGTTIKSAQHSNLINLYFNIDNLLNTAYQSHLSRLKYAPENYSTGRVGVYNMGRNISVKMIINI